MHLTGTLAEAVGVDDKSRRRGVQVNSYLQSIADEAGGHGVIRCPANDFARRQVHHRAQIQPAAAGVDVGDVAYKGLIGGA